MDIRIKNDRGEVYIDPEKLGEVLGRGSAHQIASVFDALAAELSIRHRCEYKRNADEAGSELLYRHAQLRKIAEIMDPKLGPDLLAMLCVEFDEVTAEREARE